MIQLHSRFAFALSLTCLSTTLVSFILAGQNDRTRPADKAALAMDYGSCIANTFEAPHNNLTVKGVLIKLDKEHDANLLFDTELCRVSCAWVGPNLHLASRVFSEDNDFHCTIEKEVQFATGMTPGWASGDKYDDPREPKDGPLPHEWSHYKGLYQHGKEIVLSYTVRKTDVLELPGVRFFDKQAQFTRDLRLGPHEKPLEVLMFEADKTEVSQGGELKSDVRNVISSGKPGASGDPIILSLNDGVYQILSFVGVPEGTTTQIRGRRVYLGIPPSTTPVVFRIVSERHAGTPQSLPSPIGQIDTGTPTDPEPLTHGGPPHWTQSITTHGQLATDDKAPYVIDTLPAPDDNPYHSWIRFTGIDFFPDGHSAALCTWSGDVWVVSGIDHECSELTWKRFATGLNNPMGVKIVDGIVYTIDRSQITKLVDLNGDGEADFYQNFNNDCTLTANFHEMAFDLQTDSQGNFYFSKSSAIWRRLSGWRPTPDAY